MSASRSQQLPQANKNGTRVRRVATVASVAHSFRAWLTNIVLALIAILLLMAVLAGLDKAWKCGIHVGKKTPITESPPRRRQPMRMAA